jgi:hypothetical protein
MSLVLNGSESHGRARDRAEHRQYRILYTLSFPLFLAVAIVARLTKPRGEGARRSIFVHAKALAGATIPMVFMG